MFNSIFSNLNKNTAHIFLIDLTKAPHEENFKKYLSNNEKEKSSSFSHQNLKRRYIISRAILKYLLAKYLKISLYEIEFFYGKYKKPFCRNSLSLFFNMSHSKDFISYVFNMQNDVGIDIEFINPSLNYEELIDMAFSEEEKRIFYKCDLNFRRIFFYKTWTLKEAFLKAKGVGLNCSLNELTTMIEPKRTFSLIKSSSNKITYVDNDWSFFPLLMPSYCGALAVHNKNAQPSYYNLAMSWHKDKGELIFSV